MEVGLLQMINLSNCLLTDDQNYPWHMKKKSSRMELEGGTRTVYQEAKKSNMGGEGGENRAQTHEE